MLIWARFPIIGETEEFFIAAYVFPKKPRVSQIYLLIITRFLSTTKKIFCLLTYFIHTVKTPPHPLFAIQVGAPVCAMKYPNQQQQQQQQRQRWLERFGCTLTL